ncbi:MAG: hypothetical protein P8Y70_19510 [Candidatus Lokiarchaeota archaeon]
MNYVDIFLQYIKIVVRDKNIDIVVVSLWQDHIYRYIFKRIIAIQESTLKPIIIILPNLTDNATLVSKFEKTKKLLLNKRIN